MQTTMHIPLLTFKPSMPPDGLPMLGDWVATAESIWAIGYEGFRESVEFRGLESAVAGQPLSWSSIQVSKGCGRVTILQFTVFWTYFQLKNMLTPEEVDDFKKLLGVWSRRL